MWKRWKMWINFEAVWRKVWEILTEYNIQNKTSYPQFGKKISTFFQKQKGRKNVDMVDNYRFKRDSPIFSTSPAPIVINRSPFMQFSDKNFSTSAKEEK